MPPVRRRTVGRVTAEAAYCAWCGKQAPEGAPPTWTVQSSARGIETLCEDCTRANLRSIESNLSTDYW
jgi:hypothetical protein